MKISLPSLDTEGWWTLGAGLEGGSKSPETMSDRGLSAQAGLRGFFDEWTTAHVRPSRVIKPFC